MLFGDSEASAHLALELVELGEQLLDGLQPSRGEGDGHSAAVRLHAGALDPALLLQGGHHPGQRSFGQVALGGQLSRLHLSPYPQHPQDGEAAPRQSGLGQHLPLGPAPNGRGGPINVGDGLQRVEVEGLVAKPSLNVDFGIEKAFVGSGVGCHGITG